MAGPATGPAPRHGLGIAGLVLGPCGFVVGLIPLFGLGAILLGLIGLVLGVVGFARTRAGVATNVRTAATGVVACVLAVALGVTGVVIVGRVFTQLDRDLSAVPSAGPTGTGAPTPYRASRSAAGDVDPPHAFAVTVTLTNGTAKPFDPSMMQVSMSTGGTDGPQIFDSAKNVGSPPQSIVQPGKSATYQVAFSTTSATGDAQVDVQPSFAYEHAVFTGTL